MRLDPKLRYFVEIAARKHRRTVSSYIEWSLENSLDQVQMGDRDNDFSLADEAEKLWDVYEADRFARLALRHPDLLTHEEQIRWKLIRENGALWKGRWHAREWIWDSNHEPSLLLDQLRKNWPVFVEAAETGNTENLPTWVKDKPPDDEDLPF